MKKLFALAVCLSMIQLSLTAQSKDEKQVSLAVETLKKAMIDADRQQLDNITSADLSYGHSSGKIENKAAFIEALTSGASDFITMDLTNQTIKVTGKTALVRHNLTGTTRDNGVPGNPKLGVLLVWQKQKGGWKLLARQAFRLP
jgi:ketosteroid isomerase-like protein